MAGSAIEITDGALLRRIEAGDEPAFDLLYARHQPGLFRFVLRMTGSVQMAEDAIQEVFLALVNGKHRFDESHGSLGAFLYGMARNKVLREWAGRKSEEEATEEIAAPAMDPLAGLDREQQVERVRAAVLSLPQHYREVVVLCEMDELSYERAAELLDCAVGTVRSRLHRAKALLTGKLAEVRCEA